MTMRSLPNRVITSRTASKIQVLRVGLNLAAAHRFRWSMRAPSPNVGDHPVPRIIRRRSLIWPSAAFATVQTLQSMTLSEFDPELA